MLLFLTFGACGLFCLWVLRIGWGRPYKPARSSDVPLSGSTACLPAEMQNQIKRERVLRQLQADYRRMLRETKQELTRAERMAYVKARHQEIVESFGTDELF